MGIITLWLSVEASTNFGTPTLYTKRWNVPFLPAEGQRIVLNPTEEEGPTGGVMADVKRIYFDADGGAHLTVRDWIVDPNESMERSTRYQHGTDLHLHVWETEANYGRAFTDVLAEGGWERYEGLDHVWGATDLQEPTPVASEAIQALVAIGWDEQPAARAILRYLDNPKGLS